ncbi:MAG: hypothetical protein GY696_34535 [Gammaproteobacteria bacterium]|nr:hypothetical protein [Gammaproteobacteria bacterium]
MEVYSSQDKEEREKGEAFPDHMTCQGQETRHGEEQVQNEVVFLELRVMVRDELFLINQGNIESQTEHLQLPGTVREEGCKTSAKTYVWRDKASNCHLQRVGTIAPNRIRSTWLVDHQSQLLFNTTGTFPVPGCDITLKTTQVDNVYLADLAISEIKFIRCPRSTCSGTPAWPWSTWPTNSACRLRGLHKQLEPEYVNSSTRPGTAHLFRSSQDYFLRCTVTCCISLVIQIKRLRYWSLKIAGQGAGRSMDTGSRFS